ncbi:flagellar assembly protein FliW [Aliarcobacter skirrowii]|uniref:Flagellar biosynthesis protein FliW n=1 Tax=Aliarcobacter skirrowii CCUG 10374 TaxID=1032239 RepID=A0AAD0SMH9_9BACT|nr:flagellar assembly protein FliW [Aliarcobacter skirrowii]AXX85567.1 putative flagellin level sensor protein FliW [Aliarcobacter skirrowii CCUG 10374]KAB0621024.1 flagellar biosynthesis protein FliW [Aliarcobacter skirrowii CCUG 10374]RXI26197.1 flagellar biosynthesis protein FliW [Aliarcobacter skirrowii CCUG 10374]SUU95897.1 Flagellar assembly factor FliW 2 [Aliarcobacter skirrowii]
MYKIVLPILGFENNEKLDIEKIDEYFSYLKLEDGSKISIVNINILSRVSFDFEIDQVSLDKLKIKTKDDFSTYFVLVSQNPVEHSIINLVAPIFVHEKERLVGQYVTSEKVEPYLASLNKCINL